MKTKIKHLSKSTICVILSVLMIISTGIVATNAAFIDFDSAVGLNAQGDIYADISGTSNWGTDVSYIVGKSDYSTSYNMTQLSGTKLYHKNIGSNWSDATEYGFHNGAWGANEGDRKKISDRWGSTQHTGLERSYGCNSGDTYLATITGSSNDYSLSMSWLGSGTLYDNLNSQLTIKTALKSGTTYSETNTQLGTFSAADAVKVTAVTTTTAQSINQSGGTGTITTARTNTATISQSEVTGYTFKGWKAGDLDSTGSGLTTGTYSFTNTGSAATVYAYYENAEDTYDVTVTAGSNGKVSIDGGAAVTSGTVNVGAQYVTATVEAIPDPGYSFVNWTTTGGAKVDGASTSTNATVTVTTADTSNNAGSVTANFEEKAKRTINVDVDDHAQITVSGSSVSGENQTFTSDGSFTAHVDDVISFTATGRTSSYTCDTLTCTGSAASPTISGNTGSVTVGASDSIVISATSREKTGYYFYVSAATGVKGTVTVQGASAVDVTAGNRQKFYVDDESKTFTISSTITDTTNYETPVISRVKNTIEESKETPVTITTGSTQSSSDAAGATYYITASRKSGSESDIYFWYATGANQNDLAKQGKMCYLPEDSGYVYYDIDVPAGQNICSFQGSSTWASTYNKPNVIADDNDLCDQIELKENSQNYYNYLNFKKAGKVRFVYKVSGGTAYVTTASGGGDITSFDTYYLGGRFHIKDSESGNDVYTDSTAGSWQTYSVKMPFTLDTGTIYKLETNQTIAQLAAQLNGKPPYFLVHDKKNVYATSGSSAGLNFENNDQSNKLTLASTDSLTYEKELLFSDTENNSDGEVVIYFDSSDKKIWYEVVNETAAMAESVDLTATYEGSAVSATTKGNEITLTATLTNPHAAASGDKTYTFYNTTTGEVIGTVTTTENTADITYTEDTARVDDFKVVVHSDGVDSTTGKTLRDVFDHTSVRFKNSDLYRTNVNLNGSSQTLCNSSNWNHTPMEDGNDYPFTVTLAANETYELALATAYPSSTSDYVTLEGKCPDDFYIDESLSRYCDIDYYTLTVEYQEGDDTESYVMRTYKVTPRTNCSNPTIHIITEPVAVKNEDGETVYYPGSIYAVATYAETSEPTKDLDPMKTVTYYFAEAVDDTDQSVSGDGMAIAYWNNSLDNIRMNNEGKDTQVAEIKKLDTYTAVSTPVKINNSNTIYVDMTKLYAPKAGNESGVTYKQFNIYSVELPIWATSFAFVKAATAGSDVIDTTSWNDGTSYGYSSLLLNPNRVYLLYSNTENSNKYWYSKAVVLDNDLWDSAKKNDVGTKTFKSNVVKYNASYDGDGVNNGFNKWLSDRAYSNFENDKALYFGYIGSDPGNLNEFTLANNLAMRMQTASDYHASIQNLVAEKLNTGNLNGNGFPLLQAYTDTAKNNKVNMPLFDYNWLKDDKSNQSDPILDKQFLGVDFPMYESKFNGITTYSYDSSCDPNRAIDPSTSNFDLDPEWRKAAEYLGYAPFARTDIGSVFGSGTEFDVEFYMSSTGNLKGTNGNQDITFNFSGDDDVWVYVDGVLVLDLGGAHMASAATINFTKMKVYYKTAARSSDLTNNVLTDTWPHESAYVKTVDLQALLEANGVNFNNKDGSTKHTFQMFYMERGAHDSNMSISYNLPQASGLNITTEVTAKNVNDGLKDAALYAANRDYFTYNVSAALGSGSMYSNTTAKYSGASNNAAATAAITAETEPKYPLSTNTNRVYSTTVARDGSAQTLTATYPLSRTTTPGTGDSFSETTTMTSLKGVTYSLADKYLQAQNPGDDNLEVSGKTDVSTGDFHLLMNQTATFDGKITPHSFVQVYQDSDLGKVDTSVTPIGYSTVDHNDTSNYYITSYSIYDDHSATWIKPKTDGVLNAHENNIYAADDSANSNMFYFSDYAKTSNSAAMTVTYYNDIAVGEIRISKEYNGSSDTNFYFDVEFANIFGSDESTFNSLVKYNLLTYDVIDSTGYVSRGVPYGTAGIVIQKGQTAIISGVPVETRYKVTERTKSGTQIERINKYVKGPDGSNLVDAIPSHGYAERFDRATVSEMPNATSDTYEDKNEDRYYVNMIPIVQESYVNGEYISTSYVEFTNSKTSLKIKFHYYDRALSSGAPATISQNPAQYTVNAALDDAVGSISGDNAAIREAFSTLIAEKAVEFESQALTKNVVDDYKMWTSLADAVDSSKGIGAQTNIKTGAVYSGETGFDNAKYYHTNSLSQLLGNSLYSDANKWVSYKQGDNYVDAESYENGSDALNVSEINVWLFNTPHKYNVDIYGAKQSSDLGGASTVTVNGKSMNIRVANLNNTENKLTDQLVYYNQRLGMELGDNAIDDSAYITQYDQPGYRADIEPVNYLTKDTLTTGGKNYRFAYWAFDPAGKIVASTNAYYYYRITRDTKLYAVYAESQLTTQADAGLTIYNNRNDTFVNSAGQSRTRVNVIINPYACTDSDVNIKQTALVYVNLTDKVAGYSDSDIISLFNSYKEQLDVILTENAANSFTKTSEISTSLNIGGTPITSVTLTTKGFVRNAFSDVPATITKVQPTTKDRVQYTLNIKTESIKNSKLMFVGAMYYNGNYEDGVNHWIISDNCLYYNNGTCQSLDFGL